MGHLTMSLKERDRLKVFVRVGDGGLMLTEAAEILGVSYRTALRSWKRYLEEGEAGLVHRGRGKVSNRGAPRELKESVLARYDERYPDFGPTFAAEKLEEDGLDHETLRRWLLASGRWKAKRRRAKHRSQRDRKKHFGEMVQMDGSHHDWFEGRADRCCLMNTADDATSVRYGILSGEETTEAAMKFVRISRTQNRPKKHCYPGSSEFGLRVRSPRAAGPVPHSNSPADRAVRRTNASDADRPDAGIYVIFPDQPREITRLTGVPAENSRFRAVSR